jgi:anti-sigma factor RsiW
MAGRDEMTAHEPDLIALSAYLDGEVGGTERRQMAAHLATCAQCTARLTALQTLAADFDRLPQEKLGYDLAGVIEGRLAAASRPYDKPHAARWWGLLPVSLGAAASLALGIGMGSALFGGAAAMPRVAAISVFDTLPPGGLCLGLESCYNKGAGK